MDMKKGQLPETVGSGDAIEVQICPVGDFLNVRDGRTVMQRCDAAALRAVAAGFGEPVLVDFDHSSDEGGSTEAAAWVESLSFGEGDGLTGLFRFTDKGAEAVSGRRYRFVSPVWTLGADGRPTRLLRVALTNRPQIGGEPILNSISGDDPNPPEGHPENRKDPSMDRLKEMLGLAADASDDDVIAAVSGLLSKVQNAEEEKKEAEAEAFANAHADTGADAAVLKNAYKAAPGEMKALMDALNARKGADGIGVKPVLNSMGKTPEAKGGVSADPRAEMAALPPAQRAKFYSDHKAEF